jgi:tetratricopeptide (TPR) repeat protein
MKAKVKDGAGYELSGAGAEGADLFEQATHQVRCYIGDPVATVEAALAASPAMTMGHVLKAWLHLLGTEPLGLPVAAESVKAARKANEGLRATEREQAHIAAAAHLVEGRWRAAGLALEDLAIRWPCDALALQAGHAIDFFTGDSRMLRDRIARALPAWSAAVPGYHAVLGMHAFGLEETGDYARAEALGRRSVELEPRDGWAHHAVAHVMEMQGRRREGIAWLEAGSKDWSRDSYFARHNWWHLALHHLALGDSAAVLELFDGPIYGQPSPVVLDMIDASALLWRLQLLGVDVGARWEALADRWEPIAGAGNYAFNDWHAMMAFTGARRAHAARQVLEAQERALRDSGHDNAGFTRDVGRAVALAVQAFGEGDYRRSAALLRPVRNRAARFGGSHAQRDLIDLTLLEAAVRGGEQALADALRAEREAARWREAPVMKEGPRGVDRREAMAA